MRVLQRLLAWLRQLRSRQPAKAETFVNGALQPCCADRSNRVKVWHPNPEWTVERCYPCQRKHITLHVDLSKLLQPTS